MYLRIKICFSVDNAITMAIVSIKISPIKKFTKIVRTNCCLFIICNAKELIKYYTIYSEPEYRDYFTILLCVKYLNGRHNLRDSFQNMNKVNLL